MFLLQAVIQLTVTVLVNKLIDKAQLSRQ